MKALILSTLFIGLVLNAMAQVSKTLTPAPGKDLYILRQQSSLTGFSIQHSVATNSAGVNPNRVLGNPVTYIFTGNGNYSDATNWFNNNPPPAVLPSGSEIDINPIPGGECVLDIPQSINPLATFVVFANKSFRILSDLTLN